MARSLVEHDGFVDGRLGHPAAFAYGAQFGGHAHQVQHGDHGSMNGRSAAIAIAGHSQLTECFV
jgi:hypothetical protein